MRLTIGKRISLGFGLSVLVLLVVAFMSYRSTRQLVDAARWGEHTHEVLRNVGALTLMLVDAETGQRGYIVTGEDPYLEPYQAAIPHIDELLQDLRRLTADNPSQRARLNRLDPIVKRRLAILENVISARKEKGFDVARQLLLTLHGKETMDQARQILSEVTVEEETLLKTRERVAAQNVDDAYVTLAFGSALALLLVIIGSFVITRSITGPVAALLVGAEKIGSGTLEHRIDARGNDEISDLATAFNRMAERRQGAEEQIVVQSAERARVLEAVTETVQKLAAASQELLLGATQQASGMQEQTAAVAETVTVVDEVAHTSMQAAERARAVADGARRSEEAGRAGRKAVDEVVSVTRTAKMQTDAVAEKIVSLAEQTQAIGEIVALISDIAEQTNLLALNASIEAARAGEHGRGFSVVASEVKVLAVESKKATERVRQILGAIQKTANTAVLSTEEGTRSMNAAAKSAAAAGDTIQTLEGVMVDVAEAAAQIAASAGQQATGLTQIHQAMRDISQVSIQNLAATHQAQRAASDLSALGERLTSLLSS
jgi:methyl-accepting chemotaxis protein